MRRMTSLKLSPGPRMAVRRLTTAVFSQISDECIAPSRFSTGSSELLWCRIPNFLWTADRRPAYREDLSLCWSSATDNRVLVRRFRRPLTQEASWRRTAASRFLCAIFVRPRSVRRRRLYDLWLECIRVTKSARKSPCQAPATLILHRAIEMLRRSITSKERGIGKRCSGKAACHLTRRSGHGLR